MSLDMEMVCNILYDHAQRVRDLAEMLTEDGLELSSEDKKAIRVATQPWIEELMDETRIFYLVGQPEMFRERLNFLNQFEQFM